MILLRSRRASKIFVKIVGHSLRVGSGWHASVCAASDDDELWFLQCDWTIDGGIGVCVRPWGGNADRDASTTVSSLAASENRSWFNCGL